MCIEQGWKKPRFFRKSFKVFFRFFGFDPNKPGHKISTQEEHPRYSIHSLSEHFL